MILPTQRLTVTPAEYRLLKPGLDLVGNRLADANSGHFPYRIAWEVAGIYREQECDAEMSARFIRVRSKLWELTGSRKIYVDACELAALALALRLCRSRKLVAVTDDVSTEIKLLQMKIERYRKRAKLSAIAKLGKVEYRLIAGRWRGNVAWLRCNCLSTRRQKNGPPRRAKRWRDQRQQTGQAIKNALHENFYEAPSDKHMARIVTLLTTSLRRCRYAVGLIDFLSDPQAHTDYLVGFVLKRVELNRLPGAPVPAWQAMSDRADRFREYQQEARGKIADLPDTSPSQIVTEEQEYPKAVTPPKVKVPRPFTHDRQRLTEETLIDAMAAWFFQQGTMNVSLTRQICEQAQYQVLHGHLDQYRVEKLAAISLNGVIQELRPADCGVDVPDFVNTYAGWLLGILLALRQRPNWIYRAIEVIGARVIQREQQARYDEWVARTDGSQRAAISA